MTQETINIGPYDLAHADTCLPDYWGGHHLPHVAVPVHRGIHLADVREAIISELNDLAVMGGGTEVAVLNDPESPYSDTLFWRLRAAARRLAPAIPWKRRMFEDLEDDADPELMAFFVFVPRDDDATTTFEVTDTSVNRVGTEEAPPYGPAKIDAAVIQIQRSADRAEANRRREEQETINKALAILSSRVAPGAELMSPTDSVEYLRLRFGGLEHEVFGVIWLDVRHQVLEVEEMFRGTIDGSSVHPREVLKSALRHNAAGVVCFHNHPSGVTEPSQADIRLTRRLTELLTLAEIKVVDHLIVSGAGYTSFAEKGII